MQLTPIFNYLLVFNIFAGAFCVFRQPFEFYPGYVFILAFLAVYILRYRRVVINANFLVLLVIFTTSSLVNVYLGNVTLFLMTKQVLGILITGAAYYLLIKVNNYDINRLFKIYLRIALVVAAIGIFQEFSYLVGFKIGYDYSWMWMIRKWAVGNAEKLRLLRVNSIFMEPSHFAISMAPAFFVSFINVFKHPIFSLRLKWDSLIIVASYILTFSAVAYIAILISILIFLYSKGLRYLLWAGIIMPILAFSAYISLLDIRMRINDTAAFFIYPRVTPDTHMSVYSLVSNAFVAFNSFIDNLLFGLGLGSHPVSYDKFLSLGVAKGLMQYNYLTSKYPEVCKGDAGSLFLRLLSETGLFGIIAVFYFIFKFRVKSDSNKNLLIISNAVFILFILQLLRQGHYFYNGLFFFVWIYYFAYRISKSKIAG